MTKQRSRQPEDRDDPQIMLQGPALPFFVGGLEQARTRPDTTRSVRAGCRGQRAGPQWHLDKVWAATVAGAPSQDQACPWPRASSLSIEDRTGQGFCRVALGPRIVSGRGVELPAQ